MKPHSLDPPARSSTGMLNQSCARPTSAPSRTRPWIRQVPGQGPAHRHTSHSRRHVRFRISKSGPTGRGPSRFRDPMAPRPRRRAPGRPPAEARAAAPGWRSGRMRQRFGCALKFKPRTSVRPRALAAPRARKSGSGGRHPGSPTRVARFRPPQEGRANALHLHGSRPESGRKAPRMNSESPSTGGAAGNRVPRPRPSETSARPLAFAGPSPHPRTGGAAI